MGSWLIIAVMATIAIVTVVSAVQARMHATRAKASEVRAWNHAKEARKYQDWAQAAAWQAHAALNSTTTPKGVPSEHLPDH